VVLPPTNSRLATRELLYTAVTRARKTVTIIGSKESLENAINNQIVRSSGLRALLWN
jgi:exodeoxyribonuclease V alpha subunit